MTEFFTGMGGVVVSAIAFAAITIIAASIVGIYWSVGTMLAKIIRWKRGRD